MVDMDTTQNIFDSNQLSLRKFYSKTVLFKNSFIYLSFLRKFYLKLLRKLLFKVLFNDSSSLMTRNGFAGIDSNQLTTQMDF